MKKITLTPRLKKLLFSMSVAYVALIICLFTFRSIHYFPITLFLTPIIFSSAIIASFKTTSIRHIAFFVLSMPIYWFAYAIVCINRYWFPEPEFVILGTGIGALLEMILFAWMYKVISHLKIGDPIIALVIGGGAFGISHLIPFLDGPFFPYAFWYFGVALLMYNIYKRQFE